MYITALAPTFGLLRGSLVFNLLGEGTAREYLPRGPSPRPDEDRQPQQYVPRYRKQPSFSKPSLRTFFSLTNAMA